MLLELDFTFSELDDFSVPELIEGSCELDDISVSELSNDSLEELSPWAIVFSISVVPVTSDDCEQANNRIAPSAIRYLFMFIAFTPS